MASQWIMGFILLTLPLLAGVGLIAFMMSGKKSSNTTDELLEHRKQKKSSDQLLPTGSEGSEKPDISPS